MGTWLVRRSDKSSKCPLPPTHTNDTDLEPLPSMYAKVRHPPLYPCRPTNDTDLEPLPLHALLDRRSEAMVGADVHRTAPQLDLPSEAVHTLEAVHAFGTTHCTRWHTYHAAAPAARSGNG